MYSQLQACTQLLISVQTTRQQRTWGSAWGIRYWVKRTALDSLNFKYAITPAQERAHLPGQYCTRQLGHPHGSCVIGQAAAVLNLIEQASSAAVLAAHTKLRVNGTPAGVMLALSHGRCY